MLVPNFFRKVRYAATIFCRCTAPSAFSRSNAVARCRVGFVGTRCNYTNNVIALVTDQRLPVDHCHGDLIAGKRSQCPKGPLDVTRTTACCGVPRSDRSVLIAPRHRRTVMLDDRAMGSRPPQLSALSRCATSSAARQPERTAPSIYPLHSSAVSLLAQ